MSKPRRESLASYTDIKTILDVALQHNIWPVIIKVATPGAATHWTQRANKYRVALRRQEEWITACPPGMGSSPFDHLQFKAFGHEVVIQPRPVAIMEIDGQVVDPTAGIPGAVNNLDEE